MKPKSLIFAVVVAVLVTILGASADADTLFTVTLDTTPLTVLPGSGAGPFSLAFQLTDGSGPGDGNNTATLTSFSFGGGSGAGTLTTLGGASGDLTGTVTLTDSSFLMCHYAALLLPSVEPGSRSLTPIIFKILAALALP